jgi:hypothetical protein
MRVFGNIVSRKIFGPIREKISRSCRKLHNEELYCYNSSVVIDEIREDVMGGVCNTHAMKNAYKISVRKPEGKIPFGNPRHRCEHNIKMERNKVRGCDLD